MVPDCEDEGRAHELEPMGMQGAFTVSVCVLCGTEVLEAVASDE